MMQQLVTSAISLMMISSTPAALTPEQKAEGYLSFEYMQKEIDRFLVFRQSCLDPLLLERAYELKKDLSTVMADFRYKYDQNNDLTDYLKENSRAVYQYHEIGRKGFSPKLDLPWYWDWQKFTRRILEFREDVDRYLRIHQPGVNRAKAREVFGPDVEYGIGITTGMQKVRRYEPYLGPIGKRAEISLAGNEHEGFQIVVMPFEKDLKDVRVEIGDLKTPEGAVLARSHIKAFPVGYVYCKQASIYPAEAGWWPDPLMTDASFDVPRSENKSVWIDVFAPENTKAGVYTGEIKIVPKDAEPVSVELQVKVWNYALPKKGKFHVIGRYRPDELARYYGWKEAPKDIELKWYLMQVEHRYSPLDMYWPTLTPTPDRNILEDCLKAGLNTVNLGTFSQGLRKNGTYVEPTAEQKKEIVKTLRQGVDVLKKYDALDTAYVFCYDEVEDPKLFPMIHKVCASIKAEVPEGKFATTTTLLGSVPVLAGSIDTWVPLMARECKEIDKRQKLGDEVFFYIYAAPFHPFPNASLIEYPGLDGRISFWIASEKGWNGFLHWWVNGWEPNYTGDKRWPEVPWIPYSDSRYVDRNGEGYFIYPGPNGEPLSSIRFEMIRDGIEDWEAINMMKELRNEADPVKGKESISFADQVLQDIRQLAPDDFIFNPNPQDLLRLRDRVAEAIERLQSI